MNLNPPLLKSHYKNASFRREGSFYTATSKAFQGPPRQGERHHYTPLIPHKDLKFNSRRSWARGSVCSKSHFLVRAHALSQTRAQSGHWLRPCQLLNGKLAGANEAKAASQPESPTLGMSLVKLPFHKRTVVPSEPSQKFFDTQKWDHKKQLVKIIFHCTGVYVRCWKHVLNERF